MSSSCPTRSVTPWMSLRLAVSRATIMLMMSGSVDRRVPSPTISRLPQTSSLYPTTTALRAGIGMWSETKNFVTFSRLWILPQPVEANSRPTAKRPSRNGSQVCFSRSVSTRSACSTTNGGRGDLGMS